MNKLGLYVVDKTVDNSTVRAGATQTWKRTGIMYNGRVIETTSVETNTLGLYTKDGKLMCNGSVVADAKDDNAKIVVSDTNDAVSFGNMLLSSDNVCVNITLENYNRLRAGVHVDGYPVYSEDAVYMIVNARDLGTVYTYNPALVSGHKDIIYNSFIGSFLGTSSTSGTLNPTLDNSLSKKTFTEPKYTPEIALRQFDTFIDEQEGGGILNLEYYVDTWDYASVCPKLVDADNDLYNCVGQVAKDKTGKMMVKENTFTTIIENQFGQQIFKKTTYAGVFRVSVPIVHFVDDATEPIVGKTYFSIRTIDSDGRESVVLFYDILVKPLDTGLGMYHMEETDLVSYGFIGQGDDPNNADGVFSFAEAGASTKYKNNDISKNPEYRTQAPANYKQDKRSNYFAGYRNKLALERLMLDKKAAGYTGVVLYNANDSADRSLDNATNTVYLVDCHSLKAEGNHPALSTGFSDVDIPWPETATKYYLDSSQESPVLSTNYPNDVFIAGYNFYVVKAAQDTNDVWRLYNPRTGDEIATKVDTHGNSYEADKTVNGVQVGLKANPITLVTSNDKNYARIYLDTSYTDYELRSGETLADFIRRDGAGFRKKNGKTLTLWSNVSSDETYAGGYTPNYAYHCVKRVSTVADDFVLMDGSEHKAGGTNPVFLFSVNDSNPIKYGCLHDVSKNPDYVYFYLGERVTSGRSSRNLHIPNDFTLDCNGCTLLSTFGSDLYKDFKTCVLDMKACVNSHVKNAKLVGIYGPDMVKDAFIDYQVTKDTNGEWEAAKVVALGASCLCSLTNVWIENSPGYELSCDGMYRSFNAQTQTTKTIIANSTNTTQLINQLYSGYLDYTGVVPKLVSNGIITDANGGSVVPEDCNSYAEGRNVSLMRSSIQSIQDVSAKCYHQGFSSSDSDRMEIFKNKLCLHAGGAWSLVHRLGKFHTFFVHFYKEEDGVYEYVRSYKAREHQGFYKPASATHIMVNPYMLVDADNLPIPAEVTGSSPTSYYMSGLSSVSVCIMDYTSSVVMDSCKVERTKSGAIVGPSINLTVKDTAFHHIVDVSSWCSYTNALYHIEESAAVTNHTSLINCTCYSGIGKLNFTYGRYASIIDCNGFSLTGLTNQYYIKNSKFASIGTKISRYMYNTARGIVKDSTSYQPHGESNCGNGVTNIDTDVNYNGYPRNYCDEPLSPNICVNDSLLVMNRNNVHIYGRGYQVNNIPYDAYLPVEGYLIIDNNEAFINGCVSTYLNTGVLMSNDIKIECKMFYNGSVVGNPKRSGGWLLLTGSFSGNTLPALDSVLYKRKPSDGNNWVTRVKGKEYFSGDMSQSALYTENNKPFILEYISETRTSGANTVRDVNVAINGNTVIREEGLAITNYSSTNTIHNLFFGNANNAPLQPYGNSTQFRGGVSYMKIWKKGTDGAWTCVAAFTPAYSTYTQAQLEAMYPSGTDGGWEGKAHGAGLSAIKKICSAPWQYGTIQISEDTYRIAGLYDAVSGRFMPSTGNIAFAGIKTINGEVAEPGVIDIR